MGLSAVFRKYFVASLAVVAVGLLLVLLYHARLIILLFILAGIFAYVLTFPVGWLSRWLPRNLSVGIMLLASLCLMVGFLLLFVPIIAEQYTELAGGVTGYIDSLEEYSRGLKINLPGDNEIDVGKYIEDVGKTLEDGSQDMLPGIIDFMQSFVSGTLQVILGILLVPMIMAYLLIDGSKLRRATIALLPERAQPRAERTVDAIGASLGRYIFSRTMLALFVGIANTIMLTILEVPYAVLLGGALGFVGEFVPYVGPWLTAVPAGLIILADDPIKLIPLAIFLGVVQLLENYFIGPKLFGDTMDLHPLSVIFAMFVGGSLGGFIGLFLAIPVAAALKSIFIIFILRHPEKGVAVPEEPPDEPDEGGSRPTTRAQLGDPAGEGAAE